MDVCDDPCPKMWQVINANRTILLKCLVDLFKLTMAKLDLVHGKIGQFSPCIETWLVYDFIW